MSTLTELASSALRAWSGPASSDAELLLGLLDRSISDARLRFVLPDRAVVVGRRTEDPERVDVEIVVSDASLFSRALAEGNLGFAESYMVGGWHVEQGSLEELLTIFARNRLDEKIVLDAKALTRAAALRAKQLVLGTRANVQAHYDIGDDLYAAFLDPTRGYTCGYQLDPSDSSQQLQENKYDRILKKLRIQPGQTLFDVGCGFGGLLIHAAQKYGVVGRGITNSRLHAEFGQRRARELGVQVEIGFGDFREARGLYDRVVSCGVMEHLLPHEQRAFVETLSRLLRREGFGLLHTIGCVSATNEHDPFIQKYIFPGSTQNPLSVIARQLERQRLAVLDVENIARHYAPTVRRWLEAFRAARPTLDRSKYDEVFCRMWEYYLCACVAGASATEGAVWQLLFTKEYRRPLPMHRV